jgi:biotin carboxylase
VDVSDRKAVEAAARRLQSGPGLDGVFTAGTDFSTTVAWAAKRLGLPGIPYEVALGATDKARMRTCLQEHGVPSPRFATIASGTAGRRPHGLEYPLVVKPVDNMGARGVRRVDSDEQLRSALEAAWVQSRSSRAIVEEFLDGPELSLDAVVCNGEVTVCGVADRHIHFPPYFVEMGHTMPSDLAPSRLREAEAIFARGIRALGIDNGAAKGDIKLTSRGAVVGEIAARLSGGYMSGWTFPLASGVEVTEAALRLAVGLPPGDLTPKRTHVSAERAFISIPGTVRGVSGLEEARAVRGVRELFLRVHTGQPVELPINNMGKCGNVIAAAASREQAVGAAESAVRCILIRLEAATEKTDRYLSDWLQNGFAAFPEGTTALRRALGRLPDLAGRPLGPDREVRILTPPEIDEEPSRDWHGSTLREALTAVCRFTGAKPVRRPENDAVCLGAPFWRGLLKGGVQAGVYLIDTMKAMEKAEGGAPGKAWRYLARSS